MREDLRLGHLFAGRYRLDRVIGAGGMGVVYAGREGAHERPVAVKIMQAELAALPELRERLRQEARAAASLSHPNIVRVFDMGAGEDGSEFIVLELLEGESLGERLEREGSLPPEEVLLLLLPVIDALELAHGRGIIHRDIKPQNVFLARGTDGAIVPKLLDFGVAKLLEGSAVVTRTGSVLGTPGYMSPEQLRGVSALSPASDVWSMGALLFRALSGRLPFEPDESPAVTMMAMVMNDAPRLGEVDPTLPSAICAAVDGALRRSPETRHRDMRELEEALVEAASLDGVEHGEPAHELPAGVI